MIILFPLLVSFSKTFTTFSPSRGTRNDKRNDANIAFCNNIEF